MNKVRSLIVLMFLSAFAAGVCAALVAKTPVKQPQERGGGPSFLTAELDLSKSQQEEMMKIWGGMMDRNQWQKDGEQRRQYQKQRDDAIRQLIPADKRAEVDKINETFAVQMTEMGEQRKKAFDAAVEKTKAILSPEQREKYEEFLKKRSEWRRGPGGGPGGPPSTAPGMGPGMGPGFGGPLGEHPMGDHHRWDRKREGSSIFTTQPATQPSSGDATQID